MAECLATPFPVLTRKVENVHNELGYLAKKLFSQSVRGTTCFYLVLIVKCEMRERKTQRRTVKMKELGLNDSENSQVLLW